MFTDSQLLMKARSLEQMCLCEIELLRACPTCYLNRITALPVLPSTTFVFPAISKCEPRIYRRPEMRKPTEHLNTDLAEGLWFAKPCVSFLILLVSLRRKPCSTCREFSSEVN